MVELVRLHSEIDGARQFTDASREDELQQDLLHCLDLWTLRSVFGVHRSGWKPSLKIAQHTDMSKTFDLRLRDPAL